MNMMQYLFVARTHGACVNTPNFDACVRATSDKIVACRSRCRLKIHWNMASYLLEYGIIFIGI